MKLSTVLVFFLPVVFFVFYQNCDSSGGIGISSMSILDDKNALVYGDTEDDQKLLQDKIKGYSPPGMKEIYSRWKVLSGDMIFDKYADIKLPTTLEYCNSTRNADGAFLNVIDPKDGKSRNPVSITACMDTKEFSAISWTALSSPDRVFTPFNSNYIIGFVSPSTFDEYNHQVTLTSSGHDDDAIFVILAISKDDAGNVDVLAAMRGQGGVKKDFSWGVVHYLNGNPTDWIFGPKIDKVINLNANKATGFPGTGDALGWNNRKTKVSVHRKGNLIKVYASPFYLDESDPESKILEESLIQLDLEDSANKLEIFKGAKAIGYGSISQANSTFLDVTFASNMDDQVVYDLKGGGVYLRQTDGTYKLVSHSAVEKLGYPRNKVTNPETGRIFEIKWDKSYSLLN